MPKTLRIGAVVIGIVGVLLCAAAIAAGWWAAARTAARTERVAERLDLGLSEFDAPLERVELRVHAIRADLDQIRTEAEAIAAEIPELPRARAAIELLLSRLVSSFDRADALADSLRSQAAGLRATADIVDQFNDDAAVSVPVRSAADKIDRAAAALDGLRGQIEELKVAQAVELTRGVVAVAAKALAGSELLAEGLTSAREAIAAARTQTTELKSSLISWTYIAATASTVFWLWGGLGQLCLIGWGRRTRQFGIEN